MTDLSLNVLDIAENSVKAKATLITVTLVRDTAAGTLDITVEDNGCGMTEEQLALLHHPDDTPGRAGRSFFQDDGGTDGRQLFDEK